MALIRQKMVIAALGLAAVFAGPMQAQSVAQVGGPAELPPAGFTGQQYVDSRGCVFMRAGFSGRTTWVPRIGRDRNAICSEVTPAQAAARLAQGETASAQMPPPRAPQSVGAPMATIASAMGAGQRTGVFAPIAVPGLGQQAARMPAQAAPAAPVYAAPAVPTFAPKPTPSTVAQGGYFGNGAASPSCPATAPVLQTLPIASGGTVMVCTRGDGTATGWVSPRVAGVGGAIQNPQYGAQGGRALVAGGAMGQPQLGQPQLGQPQYRAGATTTGGYVQTVIAGQAIIAPVRAAQNYAPAWKDDRLNPQRGLGTQQGWADQAQVWNNAVPAQTNDDVARQKSRQAAALGAAGVQAGGQAGVQAGGQAGGQGARVSASSMSAPPQAHLQPLAGAGQIYVQVGSFGQAANAQNAAHRLAGLGLPVAKATSTRKGQPLVAVMAGPFADAAQAQQALAMARSVGFGDAYIR